MDHAHHFLSRLDRLSLPHVELALSLYRDHKLLQIIIAAADIPENAPRVALSIADPVKGPFIVVTRDGKFVTCLGEGMKTKELPIISREKLDQVAKRVEVLRKRIQVAGINTGERGAAGKMFRAIYDGGSRLPREVFQMAAAWQPMLIVEYLKWMLDTADDVAKTREILLQHLKRTDKLHPRFDVVVRGYANSVWFIGHMATLVALDGKVAYEEYSTKVYDAMKAMPHAWSAVRQGLVGPALRGIWGAGRLGEMVLRAYVKHHGEATTLFRVIDSTCSLATIGLRHPELADEVEATLMEPLSPSHGGEGYQKALDAIAKLVQGMYKAARVEPEAFRQLHLKLGRTYAMQISKQLKPGNPYKFERAEDVPDDLALALPYNTADGFVTTLSNFQLINFALPWTAVAEAEQLYLPGDYYKATGIKYGPSEIMPLLLALRDIDYRPPGETRTTPKGADRNSPCPCGSGLKYKRCCLGKKTST
jgi:hypothetical protein